MSVWLTVLAWKVQGAYGLSQRLVYRAAHLVGFIGVANGQVVAEVQQRSAGLLVHVLHACKVHMRAAFNHAPKGKYTTCHMSAQSTSLLLQLVHA